ncbi:hypothetical protein [Nonomuraea sp. NPDC049625]|uniref:hypothetical protein n=1 Tax=Nonomuraea sp. NPDC049625 TaxID=3155775 RepID=UPI003420AAC8
MSEATSILNKAEQLQSLARTIELSQKDEQQKQRVRERIASLSQALSNLETQVKLARTLIPLGLHIDLSIADTGRAEFVRRASDGLPSNPSFNSAAGKIETSANAISAEIAQQWQTWAETKLLTLPSSRIAMLDTSTQKIARETMSLLRELAGKKPLQLSDVIQFQTSFGLQSERLQNVGDAPDELINLLQRIGGTRPVKLSECSDEEIALLRNYSMDEEIFLRRKGA